MSPLLLIVLTQAVSVPCTYRGDSVELRNEGAKGLEFLVGTDLDPGVDDSVTPVKVTLVDHCALDYVHDDFHAKRQKLAPGGRVTIKIVRGRPVKARACVYETRVK